MSGVDWFERNFEGIDIEQIEIEMWDLIRLEEIINEFILRRIIT